jgi:hypothetical protein
VRQLFGPVHARGYRWNAVLHRTGIVRVCEMNIDYLIIPQQCVGMTLVIYPRSDGKIVAEVTDSPGNCGKRGELLEDAGKETGKDAGLIFSFKEERK